MVAGMTLTDRLKAAAQDGSPEALAAIWREAARITWWCHSWMAAGDAPAAAALNADAGNLIGYLARWHEHHGSMPPGHADLTEQMLMDLVRLPAIARDYDRDVGHWIEANLCDAPLASRLQQARSLRLAHRGSAHWKVQHEILESAAVSLWEQEVDHAVESSDVASIAAVATQVEAMGFMGRPGQRLLQRIEDAQSKIHRATAATRLADIEDALHLAWAAMDREDAAKRLSQWHAAAREAGIRPGAFVLGAESWLAVESAMDEQATAHRGHMDALTRALDEVAPLDDVERAYAAAGASGIPLPVPLEARVAHRIGEARRARRRRHVLAVVTTLALSAAVVSIVLIRQRSLDYQQTLNRLSSCIESSLQQGRLAEAIDCWDEATSSSLTSDPRISAHAAGIERAIEALQHRRATAAQTLRTIGDWLEAGTTTLAEIDSHRARLEAAAKDLDATHAAELTAVRGAIVAARGDLVMASRQKRMSELNDIQVLLPAPPGPCDLDGWLAVQDSTGRAWEQLARVKTLPAADDIEIRGRIDRLERMMARLRSQADEQIGHIRSGQDAAQLLHHVPLSESAWHDAWNLVMATTGQCGIPPGAEGDYAEGLRLAETAVAVQDWRRIEPRIREASIWAVDPAAGRRLGEASTSIRSHLYQHGRRSPYFATGTRLSEIAQAMQRASTQRTFETVLESSGMLDLLRAKTANGWVYLRPHQGTLRRLESRQDLAVPPGNLEPLSGEELRVFSGFGPIEPPPIVSALAQAQTDWGEGKAPAAVQVASVLKTLESASEEDALLALAVWRVAIAAMQDSIPGLPPIARSAMNDWRVGANLDTREADAADWVRMAPKGALPPQREVRRQARQAMTLPTHIQLLAEWAEEAEALEHAAQPRGVQGVLLPRNAHGQRPVRLDTDTSQGAILEPRPDGWGFHALGPLRHGDEIEVSDGIPNAPVIIFGAP